MGNKAQAPIGSHKTLSIQVEICHLEDIKAQRDREAPENFTQVICNKQDKGLINLLPVFCIDQGLGQAPEKFWETILQ